MPQLIIVLLCCLWLWPTLASSTTYYAANGGGANCGSGANNIGAPLGSIQAGVNCLGPGDTLYIRGNTGPYDEAVIVQVTGTEAQPITIAGFPGDPRPVIRTAQVNPSVGFHVTIITYGPPEGTVDGWIIMKDFDLDGILGGGDVNGIGVYNRHVTLENMKVMNTARNAINISGAYDIVRNSQMLSCGRIQPPEESDTKGVGVYLSVPNALVENNLVDGCRAAGVEVNHPQNVDGTIRGNIIRNLGYSSPYGVTRDGNGNDITSPRGINLFDSSSRMNMYNNLIYNVKGAPYNGGNAGRCVSFNISGDLGANVFVNNTCYNTDMEYFVYPGTSNVAIIQNNIFSQVTGDVGGGSLTGTNDHNLFNPNVNATFINAGGGDFHLQTGSLAINAGVDFSGTFSTDIEGTPRGLGGAWDLGAYEAGSAPPATKLAFTGQPVSTPANQALPAVVVQIQDANGNVSSGSTLPVTVALTTPGGATLSGTKTRAAVSGQATFNDLMVNLTGTYTLTATASGLTNATSTAFQITGGPTRLRFTQQPQNTPVTLPMAAVQVSVVDASDNVVTGSAYTVTLALGANPGGSTLSGTLSQATVSGVATFNGLSLNNAGNGYTLLATATPSGLTNDTSAPFNVLAPIPRAQEWVAQETGTWYCAALGGDSNLASVGSGSDHLHTLTCTIPANLLKANSKVRSCVLGRLQSDASPPNLLLKFKAGTTSLTTNPTALFIGGGQDIASWVCSDMTVGGAPGPAAATYTSWRAGITTLGSAYDDNQIAQPLALATNTPLTLGFASQFTSAGNAATRLTQQALVVKVTIP